jgi:hypothetical protein
MRAAAYSIAKLAISGTAAFHMGQRLMLPLSMQPQVNANPVPGPGKRKDIWKSQTVCGSEEANRKWAAAAE